MVTDDDDDDDEVISGSRSAYEDGGDGYYHYHGAGGGEGMIDEVSRVNNDMILMPECKRKPAGRRFSLSRNIFEA